MAAISSSIARVNSFESFDAAVYEREQVFISAFQDELRQISMGMNKAVRHF